MTQRKALLKLLEPGNRVLIKLNLIKRINPKGNKNWATVRLKRINHVGTLNTVEASFLLKQLQNAGLKIKDHE